MFKRARHQFGWLERKKRRRGPEVWVWRRRRKLPGRPDFIFTKCKVVVFIDGDFWHGNPKKFRIPKSNRPYWKEKITGNRKRDRRINKELKTLGWRVIRFWESSLGDEEAIIAKLKLLL